MLKDSRISGQVRKNGRLAPALKATAIALIFFQRSGIEDTENIVADAHGLDPGSGLFLGLPVEGIDILQQG